MTPRVRAKSAHPAVSARARLVASPLAAAPACLFPTVETPVDDASARQLFYEALERLVGLPRSIEQDRNLRRLWRSGKDPKPHPAVGVRLVFLQLAVLSEVPHEFLRSLWRHGADGDPAPLLGEDH